jgi:serine/threonine-protein phosphatase 2A regulatory subunit A
MGLGKERTINELMPYIMDLMDDDEEVLIALAETLDGKFLDYVGGPLFAPHLFKPLEKLCEVEESTVRDKAVQSIKHIFSLVSVKDMKQQII